jgi:hypothetical protein
MACAATCLQLAKADTTSAAHRLVNQLRCAIQCHGGTGTSPPPLRPLQCQPPIILRPGLAPCTAVARTGRNLPWHCWREYPPRHEHTTTIAGGAANDPRQHARQRRPVARGVVAGNAIMRQCLSARSARTPASRSCDPCQRPCRRSCARCLSPSPVAFAIQRSDLPSRRNFRTSACCQTLAASGRPGSDFCLLAQ